MRIVLAASVAALVSLAVGARAAEPTAITIDPVVPADPRYSQAIAVTLHLARTAGGAVVGSDCQNGGAGQPCRVEVSIAPAGSPDADLFVFDPALDTNGEALVRLTFVDGRYGTGSTFAADDTGAPYVITAVFRGSGDGLVVDNPECADGGTPDPAGGLCPSSASRDVPLFPETAEISLGAGLEGGLGDTLTLSAELKDPNGDAAAGGTDVDGPGPVVLGGRSVAFFYDQDKNGRPDAAELIDRSETNASGVASLSFTLDPVFVAAGTYEQGIHAEFGGDGQYGVARASTRLVVRPGALDIAGTILEADPPELPADNFSKTTIRARLVDAFNNPLDETSEPHEVVFTTDAGRLVDEVSRDPANGTYAQELQAQLKPATATIRATIDGVPGPSISVPMVGEPGGCTCGCSEQVGGATLFAILLFIVPRRSSHRRCASSTSRRTP